MAIFRIFRVGRVFRLISKFRYKPSAAELTACGFRYQHPHPPVEQRVKREALSGRERERARLQEREREREGERERERERERKRERTSGRVFRLISKFRFRHSSGLIKVVSGANPPWSRPSSVTNPARFSPILSVADVSCRLLTYPFDC